MKKLLKSVICFATLVSILATGYTGTLPKVSAASPVEISFLNIYTTGSGTFDKIIDKFNSSQNKVKVNPIYVPGSSYSAVLEQYQNYAMAGKAPEVTLVGLSYSNFMINKMPIVPVSDFVKKDNFKIVDFYPTMLKLGKDIKGKQWILPLVVSTPVLFYSKKLFVAAGLDPSKPPKTLEEVKAAAKKIASTGKMGVFFGGMSDEGAWIFQGLMETLGGSMLSKDKKKATFDSAAGIKALTYVNDIIQKDKSMKYMDELQGLQTFIKGEIGMYIQSTALLSTIAKSSDIGVSNFPYENRLNLRVPAGGNCLAISKSTAEKQAAAWEFVKYLTSANVTAAIGKGTGYMAVRKSAVKNLLSDYLKSEPRAAVTYNQLNFMTPVENFPGENGTKIPTVLKDKLQAVLTGSTSPEEGLKAAATEINKLLN